nr:MAG TPA: hypothetical protein [Caudoviricetes sp.]
MDSFNKRQYRAKPIIYRKVYRLIIRVEISTIRSA